MTDDEFVCAEFGIIDFYDIEKYAPDRCQRDILWTLHERTDGEEYTDSAALRRLLLDIGRRYGKSDGFRIGEKGDPSVVYSWAHLNFVSEVRVSMWSGRNRRREVSTYGAKLAFPALELILVRSDPDSDFYLKDLDKRWNRAGEVCGWKDVVRHPDRKIALVDSPIWRTLGNGDMFDDGLGIDYPPFYINGGRLFGWDSIGADEFEDFPKPTLTPGRKEIADTLRRLGPEFMKELMAELEG